MNARLQGIFQLARPVNCLITMLSVFLAAVIAVDAPAWLPVVLAMFSAGIIAAGANTINDVFDLEIDKINKPDRPLPSGKISIRAAGMVSAIEFLSGILLALTIGRSAFLIASGIVILMFLYSRKFKRQPLTGNFAVSFAGGMAFIYGGLAAGNITAAYFPALFAFLFHFGREIIKDIQDREGDRRDNARTFPLVAGLKSAQILTSIVFIILATVTLWAYMIDWYNQYYMIIILAGLFPVLIYSTVELWRDSSFKKMGFVSNLLKADMLVGLMAIYFG